MNGFIAPRDLTKYLKLFLSIKCDNLIIGNNKCYSDLEFKGNTIILLSGESNVGNIVVNDGNLFVFCKTVGNINCKNGSLFLIVGCKGAKAGNLCFYRDLGIIFLECNAANVSCPSLKSKKLITSRNVNIDCNNIDAEEYQKI